VCSLNLLILIQGGRQVSLPTALKFKISLENQRVAFRCRLLWLKADLDQLERDQRRAVKITKGQENEQVTAEDLKIQV